MPVLVADRSLAAATLAFENSKSLLKSVRAMQYRPVIKSTDPAQFRGDWQRTG